MHGVLPFQLSISSVYPSICCFKSIDYFIISRWQSKYLVCVQTQNTKRYVLTWAISPSPSTHSTLFWTVGCHPDQRLGRLGESGLLQRKIMKWAPISLYWNCESFCLFAGQTLCCLTLVDEADNKSK